MLFKGRSRPSKFISALAVFVGICFIVIGLIIAVPELGIFGWLWTIVAIGITVFHFLNLISPDGLADSVHDFGPSEQNHKNSATHVTIEQRLDALERLKRKGKISQAEYEKQRQNILSDL